MMTEKKDAFYFPHDSNAKDDPKVSQLIETLGLEGYGLYWVLVETLRDQPGYRYPIALLPVIARKYNTTHEKCKILVGGYGLFTIDEENFFSDALCRRMEKVDQMRAANREKGIRSGEVRRLLSAGEKEPELNSGSTAVQPELNQSLTGVEPQVNKEKESKLKEIKEKESTGSDAQSPTLFPTEEPLTGKTRKRKKPGRQSRPGEVEYAEHVFMTPEKHAALIEDFGIATTERMIYTLDNYTGSTGKQYQDHACTIRNWIERDRRDADRKGARK